MDHLCHMTNQFEIWLWSWSLSDQLKLAGPYLTHVLQTAWSEKQTNIHDRQSGFLSTQPLYRALKLLTRQLYYLIKLTKMSLHSVNLLKVLNVFETGIAWGQLSLYISLTDLLLLSASDMKILRLILKGSQCYGLDTVWMPLKSSCVDI